MGIDAERGLLEGGEVWKIECNQIVTGAVGRIQGFIRIFATEMNIELYDEHRNCI